MKFISWKKKKKKKHNFHLRKTKGYFQNYGPFAAYILSHVSKKLYQGQDRSWQLKNYVNIQGNKKLKFPLSMLWGRICAVKEQLHWFLTSALRGGDFLPWHFSRFVPEEEP
jgi:hypothetical protein